MHFNFDSSTLTAIAHALLVIGIGVRVIMARPATGVALAWIALVAGLPFAGAAIYFLIGERRIGTKRARALRKLRTDFARMSQTAVQQGRTDVDWSRHDPAAAGMDRLGRHLVGSATFHGSDLQLLSDTQEVLTAIARDIDDAKKSVLMEFYIWNAGGTADEVLEALIRAAERGVSCRLLVDAVGARPWWKGQQPRRLREAGVDVRPALPAGLLRMFIGRADLRLHRKIVVVDGHVAWTGSMNLVDPRFFKQDAGVGEWVDAMVRVTGAAVAPLAATMIGDWALETGESIDALVEHAGLRFVEPAGTSDVQVIPSGPGESDDTLLQMLLALVNAARNELVLTTPYLVADESLLRALRGAAGAG